KYPEVFAEAKAAEESGNIDAQNLAEMHLFLDGPRRRRGYVKEPLRDVFLKMNGPNLRIDWGSAPSPDVNPPAAEVSHEISVAVRRPRRRARARDRSDRRPGCRPVRTAARPAIGPGPAVWRRSPRKHRGARPAAES